MSQPTASPSAQDEPVEGPELRQILADLRNTNARQALNDFVAKKTSEQLAEPEPPVPEEQGVLTLNVLKVMKINEIKDVLRANGKRVTGNKEDLIARILGLEEPSMSRPKIKKRPAGDMADGEASDEEEEELDQPPAKKFKVDRADPIWNMCFLCQAKEGLTKYKDVRQCLKCKTYWKGKRLLRQDAEALFLLNQQDLENLPHRDTQSTNGPVIPLYAFATCAGAAVKRYGSLYHMVKSDPAQRELLATHLTQERNFAESQKTEEGELDPNGNAHTGEEALSPAEEYGAESEATPGSFSEGQ